MLVAGGLIFLTSLFPLAEAWRKNRQSTLAHALAWAMVAWLAWGCVVLAALLEVNGYLIPGRYLALCLLGCTAVAVLGARRPGAAAWNFVVAGLLAVFLLWLGEGALLGRGVELGPVRTVFLAGGLAIGAVNYLPTRLGPAMLLLAGGCILELRELLRPAVQADLATTTLAFGLAPWLAWLCLRWARAPAAPLDRLWREFRDRYGLVWGQLVRDQFNRSAANAGLDVELAWQGLRKPAGDREEELLVTLQALLKRFGTWS